MILRSELSFGSVCSLGDSALSACRLVLVDRSVLSSLVQCLHREGKGALNRVSIWSGNCSRDFNFLDVGLERALDRLVDERLSSASSHILFA